ncbi:MAG: S8 family serine peptidase [Bacteroidales bacterium]|nr:S8 family serine peptidase [Bacteroidales bacterium]
MNKFYFFCVAISISLLSSAQLAPNTYWIQFKNKNNTSFSLTEPEAYLSDRAIGRRERYSIAIDSTDLPVNSWYLDSLVNKGASILIVSKWFNGAAIYTDNSLVLDAIYQLDFVDQGISTSTQFSMNFFPENEVPNTASIQTDVFDYGSASSQINLHAGQVLHNHGYQGQGMIIAILDSGFDGIDQIDAFDSIFDNHQILATWDFVAHEANVYNDHNHGKSVLSTIAANIPGSFIGTAPKANFLLFRTENTASEYKIEEINWIAAAEMADSIGADVVNTSLGYNIYSLPSHSYTWNDLNDVTAPITIATNMAADKGMLMVTSAGNEGTNSWKKITSPADASKGLTVGACDANGNYVSFSSKGFTVDGDIKPDVCAMGQSATVITASSVTTGNGTSFSSPIMCGLATCLWQVNRNKTNMEIIDLIQRHSNQYNNPDSLMGYGIPNFSTAYEELTTDIEIINSQKNQLIKIYPTVFNDELHIKYFSTIASPIELSLFDMRGQIIFQSHCLSDSNVISYFNIPDLSNLSSGVYILKLVEGQNIYTEQLIKY